VSDQFRVALVVLACSLLGSLSACTGSSGSGSADRASATTSTTLKLRPATADLQFRPVLRLSAAVEGRCRPPDPSLATDLVAIPSADRSFCYVLGPSAGNAADIAAAHVEQSASDWSVVVKAVPGASTRRLNAFLNACYRGTASCPGVTAGDGGHGAAAVMLDGGVITSPSVNGRDLASESFTIAGSFTEAQATKLAHALNRVGG